MRRCPIFLLVFLLLPALQLKLYPFEWPVEPERVVSTFGEYRRGSFFKGLEIETRDKYVRAIEAGEIIFSAEEIPRHNGALPSGMGNSVVIEHERGIRSVYGYLSGIPVKLDKRTLEKSERLPISGAQADGRALTAAGESLTAVEGPGASERRSEDDIKLLYLKILDSELEQAVNPLLSLPSVEDTGDVVIESVALVPVNDSGGRSTGSTTEAPVRPGEVFPGEVRLGGGGSVEAGEYEIHIEAFDSYVLEGRTLPLAPFSFRVYINGEEELNIRFEYIMAEEKSHTLAGTGSKGASGFYRDKWRYCPGTLRLNSGDAMIEVVVGDIAGNETAESYRFRVR